MSPAREASGKRQRPAAAAAALSCQDADGDVCSVRRSCGGCELICMAYDRQLEQKQTFIDELFNGNSFPACTIEPIAGMQEPFRFRDKIISPFAPGGPIGQGTAAGKKVASVKGGPSARTRGVRERGRARHRVRHGLYERGTHRIVEVDCCPVEHPSGRRVVAAVARLMERYGVSAYDEDAGRGFMRHAVVRVGHESGEVLVTLVTNGRDFPGSKNFCRELVKLCPEITSVVQNVNLRRTNAVLGDEERVLYGPGFILDSLCGLSFRISSRSFYQVNAVQTEVLYRTAVGWALEGAPAAAQGRAPLRIMDAYCGTGAIGLVAASMAKAASVVGVDRTASAVADARLNARHNGLENAVFVADDAGAYLRACAACGESFDVLLMDPPRAGSSEEFLRAASQVGVGRIVYISCNPQTQRRDVLFLQGVGYRLVRVRPVDMFPHTRHIECVALLERI